MGEESNVLHLPIRVSPIQGNENDLEKINRLTLEPLTLEEIFIFSGVCSNDRMDSYFTRMDPNTTLRNYAEDLKTGVALLEGHDIWQNPYGRSFDGSLLDNEVRGSWYILRDTVTNGNNSNDTIKNIKGGIIRDMSVGFGGPDMQYICSVDGQDLYDTPYWPGDRGPDGNPVFFWIKNARLREVSTVYKGSCPGAFIDKARAYAEQGELPESKILQLEQRYQFRLDDGKRSFYFTKKESEKDVNVLEQLRVEIKENKIEKSRVYEILNQEGEPFRQPEDIALRNELGESATVDGVKTLKREAEQGRQYVADLIDQAVQSRVRAQGDAFDEERYRHMLVRSDDLEYIKEEITTYNKLAESTLTPGRQTTPNDPNRGAGDPDDDVVVSEEYEGDDK